MPGTDAESEADAVAMAQSIDTARARCTHHGMMGLPKVMLGCPPAKKNSASASVDTMIPVAAACCCSCSCAICSVLCLRNSHVSRLNLPPQRARSRLDMGTQRDAGSSTALSHAAAIALHYRHAHEEARSVQLI